MKFIWPIVLNAHAHAPRLPTRSAVVPRSGRWWRYWCCLFEIAKIMRFFAAWCLSYVIILYLNYRVKIVTDVEKSVYVPPSSRHNALLHLGICVRLNKCKLISIITKNIIIFNSTVSIVIYSETSLNAHIPNSGQFHGDGDITITFQWEKLPITDNYF